MSLIKPFEYQLQKTNFQNLLINPSFEIWQRGSGSFTSDDDYTADLWKIDMQGVGESVSVDKGILRSCGRGVRRSAKSISGKTC